MRTGSGKIKALLFSLCLFCLMLNAGSVTGAWAEEITVTTAEKMWEDCKREGPFVVVDVLADGDGKQWKEVLAKVAAGDNDWILTSACLSIGVAFSISIPLQSLDIAWAKALPKNPVGVLGLLGEVRVATVAACSMPFIYPPDGKGPGPEFIEAYMKNTLGALETITDDLMKPVAEDCERYLKDAYERYKNRKEQLPENGN